MGRGRAKAKQVKVARQLKYNSGGTDLDRLRAEILGVPEHGVPEPAEPEDVPAEDEDDLYAKYAVDDEDEEPYGGNGHRSR